MNIAYPFQKFQDWFTQQWVIWRGRKLDNGKDEWLLGPFGNVNGIGKMFINQLAEKENLVIDKQQSNGLIPEVKKLIEDDRDFERLSNQVVDFYQQTSAYSLGLKVHWNPYFKIFGWLVNRMFSNRINQLNIPLKNNTGDEILESEIINLLDSLSGDIKYTFWLRSFRNSNTVIYTGIYGLCELPNGDKCVKAIFPLPNGSATVILKPSVTDTGGLILDASGKQFGDAGFYFLMKDTKGQYWSRYIPSFKDTLHIYSQDENLIANQIMKIWGVKILEFNYKIY
jgi:hypothetical protein